MCGSNPARSFRLFEHFWGTAKATNSRLRATLNSSRHQSGAGDDGNEQKEDMAKFTPKRALITGASSGIGAALAERLVKRGVEVWLAARRTDRLHALKEDLERKGGTAHVLALDVGDAERTYETLERLDVDSDGIDLVVANAGIG